MQSGVTKHNAKRRMVPLLSLVGILSLLAPACGGAAPPAQSTPAARPAPVVTISEISRHPTDMPDSANYTLYQDGRWEKPVERKGPITIEARFQIKEGVAQVVDGTYMTYWTFNGGIPGPMIRARDGDTVDFFLQNPRESSMPHNVDFHAVSGPGGGSVRLDTAPGATSHLRVKLMNPGIYIYHCAFPDIPTHLAHGMYGLVVVEPKDGLPRVDHEYYIMQSELYTTEGGKSSAILLKSKGLLDYSSEYGNLEQPTFVMFNGRPDSITGARAIGTLGGKVKTGETIRLFVGNAGPNLVSSFHVIGAMFDKVYMEGSFDLVNKNVQTTLVPAGGAVGIEMMPVVPGDYLMVDHSIFRTHKGAAGVIHVEGPENPDVYNSIDYSKGVRGGP